MARKDNRIKTKANYTLSKRHVLTPDGAIYEHDYFTIQELGEDEQTFSESNFKFKIRPGGNPRKRHARGKWDEWESNGETGTEWTLDTVDETVSDDTKIVIKPDYSSLRDFACYGSATELVRASINDIVQHFPGSIILTTEPANKTSDDDGNEVWVKIYDAVDGSEHNQLYKVSNETLVDVDSPANISLGDDEDKLKFLQLSIDDYCDDKGNNITASTDGQASYPWCDGTIVAHVTINGAQVLVYYKDSQKYLLSRNPGSTVLARVKEKKVKEYFDTLDDFEKVLLDRSSKPLYCAKFETPYMDDYGYHYRMESYIFPTVNDGFTPDLSSSAYSMYLERLIKLADFHDNYDSDNIWRMMTHEAIKNLDWTFIRNKDGEVEDASDIDSTRIGKILRIYGREYDDILLMINGIKSSNRITYDEKNNTPDYFLSDQNELAGWELTNVSPTTDNTLTVKIGVKNGENGKKYKDKYYEEYNGVDANSAFLRRLKLNSNYINSMKGTRQGIETLLGLFGMISKERVEKLKKVNPDGNYTADYELKEYIVKATGDLNYDDIVEYNSKKDMESGESVDIDPLSGLPLALVEEIGSDGQTTKKVIPWFDPDLKYDGDTYFQMKGGWGKVEEKDIKLEIAPKITTITANGKVELYSETLGYLRFADTLTEMLEFNYTDLRDNDVCYVTNISKLSDYDETVDVEVVNNASHYFILKNKNYSTVIGKDKESGCIGWKSISKQEIENNSTEDATRVLYLESLKQTEKGNNPHCGYGNYDNGKEYLNLFEHIFGYAVDNNMFSSLEKNEIEEIKKIGFNVSDPVEDNTKIEYFKDSSIDFSKLSCEKDGELSEDTDKLDKEESDADEIINVKKFTLEFTSVNKDDAAFKEARKEYILNVIMPFVEQMIPSTAIFDYKIA